MESVTRVQILAEAVCFSFHSKDLGKSIYPSVLSLPNNNNNRADWVLWPKYNNYSRKRKTLNSDQLYPA